MCKFSSKSGGVPFQPLGDLTWNDPSVIVRDIFQALSRPISKIFKAIIIYYRNTVIVPTYTMPREVFF